MAQALTMDTVLPGTRHTQAGGVQTHYEWRATAGEVHGGLLFGADAEGLPGFVHGGALSAIADEAMGLACWCEGHCAPGADVRVQFLAPVRAGDRGEVVARVREVDGRKLHAEAEVTVQGKIVARATGLFVSVPLRDRAPFAGWPGLDRFDPPA